MPQNKHLKRQLIVIAKDERSITLVNQDEGCSSCSSKSVCGVGVLSKFMDKAITKNIGNEYIDTKIGDIITLEMDNKLFIKSALMLYLMPIFSLFIGSILADILFSDSLFLQFLLVTSFLILPIFIIKIRTLKPIAC